ncbi:MAG: hypothetical protein ABIQ40_13600 [Bacteroidia bacterium]
MRRKLIIYGIILVLCCSGYLYFRAIGSGIRVSEFHPFTNYKSADKSITVDLTDAVYKGIEIPTVKQLPGGKFTFTFNVKNQFFNSRKLYYKIYYQDESYKFPEFQKTGKYNYENALASRNFYGSWGETEAGFKPTQNLGWGDEITITDSFRIIGNPRNEELYFGKDDRAGLSALKIANMINYIHSQPSWMSEIDGKAKANGVTEDQQIYRDAVWQINNNRRLLIANNRWKRNPRTGNYKFILVVTTESGMQSLPASVRDITKRESSGKFINPFYYFLYGPGSKSTAMNVIVADDQLVVKAKLDPGAGVYVNPFELMQSRIDTTSYSEICGTDSVTFRNAQFMQYFFYEDKSHILPTIPVAADVVGENYTRAQYEENKNKYTQEQRMQDYLRSTISPCSTVSSDPQEHSITLSNPGNTEMPYRKENVGVKSRVGFTYGKFDMCIAFPAILSEDHVWNGLTNAVWLLYQDEEPWNSRRSCEGGYIPKTDNRGAKAARYPMQSYSEIDFEIMKSSRNWPKSSYGDKPQPANDNVANTDDIAVACTNWDLACREPKNYVTGIVPLVFENRKYELHRWDSWYQALTIKSPATNTDLFKQQFYWYEIEWMPEHIVWRVGPDKEHLRVVGYMDQTVTAVPDNQMILVVSQEFHDSEWWVPAPYDQRNVPYPKVPLTGKILAVEIH